VSTQPTIAWFQLDRRLADNPALEFRWRFMFRASRNPAVTSGVENRGEGFWHPGLMRRGVAPSPRILMNILVAIGKLLLIALPIPANLSE
jgi:hypothetical protein